MRPFDLVTFDCYGTLIDWEGGISKAIDSVAKESRTRVPTRKLVRKYIASEMALEQSSYRPYREIQALVLRSLFEEHFEMTAPTPFQSTGSFLASGSRDREKDGAPAERERIRAFCRERMDGASYPAAKYYPDLY